ncbi:MAG: NAD(P)H-hydrate dehydratase [Candidatus Methanofastidiosia archaeon]
MDKKTYILDANCRYFGLTTLQLMENAGRGVALEIERRFGQNLKIGIFCGLGNNGGDGFVAARFLQGKNDVCLYLLGSKDDIKTEVARRNLEILQRSGLEVFNIKDSKDEFRLDFDLVVDAMLGSGISGELREPFREVVRKLNESKAKKISIDLPTKGFKADLILSMHFPKTEGAVALDIGIPKEFESFVGPGDVKFLKRRRKDSHKGENGKVLIVGGSKRYVGAPVYAGLSASKLSDLVFISTSSDSLNHLKAYPDFIVSGFSEIKTQIGDVDSVLVGCGLGTSKEIQKLVNGITFYEKKLIFDADALKVLKPENLGENCIVTPHEFEFKRLFGLDATEKNVLRMASKYGCVIVLKGRTDIICGRELKYNFTGNEGMTTGGTGDVLAGVIVGFASTNALFESACAGAFVTGLAGDMVLKEKGIHYTALDVISKISEAVRWCEEF